MHAFSASRGEGEGKNKKGKPDAYRHAEFYTGLCVVGYGVYEI